MLYCCPTGQSPCTIQLLYRMIPHLLSYRTIPHVLSCCPTERSTMQCPTVLQDDPSSAVLQDNSLCTATERSTMLSYRTIPMQCPAVLQDNPSCSAQPSYRTIPMQCPATDVLQDDSPCMQYPDIHTSRLWLSHKQFELHSQAVCR